MSKKMLATAIAIIVVTAIISVSITAFILTQNQSEIAATNNAAAVTTNAATEQSVATDEKHSNEVIVMRSYYIGYLIDNPDQIVTDAIADGKGDINICTVINNGERYHDTMTGADFVMQRREDRKDVPFRLPETVMIYDLRGLNYQDLISGVNTDTYREHDKVMTDYGQIKLYHQ